MLHVLEKNTGAEKELGGLCLPRSNAVTVRRDFLGTGHERSWLPSSSHAPRPSLGSHSPDAVPRPPSQRAGEQPPMPPRRRVRCPGPAWASVSFSKASDGLGKILAKSTSGTKGLQNTPKNRIRVQTGPDKLKVLNLCRNHQLHRDSDRETLVLEWVLRGKNRGGYRRLDVSHTSHVSQDAA